MFSREVSMPTTIRRFQAGGRGFVRPNTHYLKPGERRGFTSFELNDVVLYGIECSPDDSHTTIRKMGSSGGLLMIQSPRQRLVVPSLLDTEQSVVVKLLQRGEKHTIITTTDNRLSAGFEITHS
jgi:hypothetical protein